MPLSSPWKTPGLTSTSASNSAPAGAGMAAGAAGCGRLQVGAASAGLCASLSSFAPAADAEPLITPAANLLGQGRLEGLPRNHSRGGCRAGFLCKDCIFSGNGVEECCRWPKC